MKELLRKFPSRHEQEWIAHVIDLPWSSLWLESLTPTQNQLEKIEWGIVQIREGMPLDYLIGTRTFAGYPFRSDKRALAPRLETELLFERFCSRIKPKEGETALDLCTGSGVLGISLKRRYPKLHVILSDISREALSLAQENGEGIEIEYLLGDLAEPFKGRRADYILCNPPYLSEEEYREAGLPYEPREALVGGERGEEFYERLAEELPSIMNPGALVGLEIGSGQGNVVRTIFKEWYSVAVEKDLSGCDRFVFLHGVK